MEAEGGKGSLESAERASGDTAAIAGPQSMWLLALNSDGPDATASTSKGLRCVPTSYYHQLLFLMGTYNWLCPHLMRMLTDESMPVLRFLPWTTILDFVLEDADKADSALAQQGKIRTASSQRLVSQGDLAAAPDLLMYRR
ncbi:unnamed protein product [Rangifer tarandus platyrhynchus]|uniref:Uncharacterized protein n=1 Tax=Rangifer tarandus platyrhynchus TaxID=3082113 RepID=A0AC59ZGQ7_RANTA